MWNWLWRLFGGSGVRRPSATVAAPVPASPRWLAGIPSRVVAVDVETTGLTASDRIVSLAAVLLDTRDLAVGGFDLKYLHIVVDPGRRSHPEAERLHGYPDWLLRQQEPFAAHAEQVRGFIHNGAVMVAHNAAFDLEFVNRELVAAGQKGLRLPVYCTMEGFRQTGAPGSASLDAVCRYMNIGRLGSRHDAIEDAWLALMACLWLHDCPYQSSEPAGFKRVELRANPATSPGMKTARPSPRLAPEAHRIDDLVTAVKAAKREGRMAEAVVLLKREVDRQEAESSQSGLGVAPWYYEQLAIIYRKHGLLEEELEILQRYERQIKAPGRGPTRLAERLAKIRVAGPLAPP